MSKKKSGKLVWIIAIIISALICLPAITRLFNDTTEPDEEEIVVVEEEFEVLEAMIRWEQNSSTLNLIGGNIKTNKKVANIYVNVNGVGVEYLEFKANPIETNTDFYIAHVLQSRKAILSSGFDDDITLTVDVYVEYKQKSYKIDTQEIFIPCAWTPAY